MERILDISGMLKNGEFLEEDTLIGRVVLNENNNFEGIAEKLFSNDQYFVFGNLNSEEIDFIIGNDELTEVPKRIHGFLDENLYAGDITAKDVYVEIPFGECRIRVYPAEQTRELSDYEMSVIKKNIKYQKSQLGERTKELYDAFKTSDCKVKKIGQK